MAADDLYKFVVDDENVILPEVVANYESILNRKIAPSDPEMLQATMVAYQKSLAYSQINHTGRQNLIDFATGAALEHIGFLFNVQRLPASAAYTTIAYTIAQGNSAFVIPKGNRVKSNDGNVIFQTIKDINVPADDGSGVVMIIKADAVCLTSGKAGNGYVAGKIVTILDPLAFVSSASNITTSEGGADDETDDELRERIKLAPSTFSVAGPTDAYKYFAKTASSKIVDVEVISPTPGTVNIYPLLEGGALPDTAMINAVQDICNDKKVRPINDTVVTLSPTNIGYNISYRLILKKGAVSNTAIATANAALEAFREERKNKLGLDVVREQIIGLIMADKANVYKVMLDLPSADIIADKNEYTNLGTINGSVESIADE